MSNILKDQKATNLKIYLSLAKKLKLFIGRIKKRISNTDKGDNILRLILLILLIMATIFDTNHFSGKTSQTRHIIIGAWTEGFFNPAEQKLYPEKLVQFENLIHKKVTIAHYYIGWEALDNAELITQFNTIYQAGWEPMLSVNPYYFSECPLTSLPLYRAIADGKCDNFLRKAGKNLSSVKYPFYLLFAWEMNNPQNTWSVQQTGSNPADFINAWQHIHNIFHQAGANNIIWVFCPNVPNDLQVPYDLIYPGSDYVNWIGLDGYNWGTTQSWSKWESFSEIFSGAYNDLIKIAPNKPVVIAEVNSTDQGGDKAKWYTDMLTKQIPLNFPKIVEVVFFNEDRSSQEHVNWSINKNSSSLNALIKAVHTKYY